MYGMGVPIFSDNLDPHDKDRLPIRLPERT